VGAAVFAGIMGTSESVTPGMLPEQTPVVQEGATPPSSPVELKTIPNSEEQQPQLAQEPARFAIYPVTINAAGFEPVKKTAAEMIAITQAGWLELANAGQGALSTQTEIEVKAPQKVTIEGLKNIKDFCKKKVPNFRGLLLNAVLPQRGGPETDATPIIVINQKQKNACFTADAGVGMGMVFYDQDYFTPYGVTHEGGHSVGLGHSNALSDACGSVISLNCVNVEYGDNSTVMGGYRFGSGDPDPLNGVALKNLGAIKPHEIAKIGLGETTCALDTITHKLGKPRLARIPITPTEITVNKKNGSTATISSIYFELSSIYTDADKQRTLSLKVIGADDNAEKGTMPGTFLIPVQGRQSFTGNDVGKTYTFEIGGRKISFTLKSIPTSNKNIAEGAQVSIGVVNLEPPYISGV